MATSLLTDARFDDEETRNQGEFTGDVSDILKKINQAGRWTIRKQSLRRRVELCRDLDRIERYRKSLHV